jgi:hypothetical protein
MAMPVIVPVGRETAEAVRERLVQEIPKLRIGVSTDPNAQMGPVVTPENKKRIEGYIQLAVDEGSVDELASRNFGLNGIEEADKLLVPVRLHASGHALGREQSGGAVALVVVRHGAAAPRPEISSCSLQHVRQLAPPPLPQSVE